MTKVYKLGFCKSNSWFRHEIIFAMNSFTFVLRENNFHYECICAKGKIWMINKNDVELI